MTEPQPRVLDLPALKGLAHPLRVRLFDKLSELGPLTASGLAELLGESSGATSYHLRQLAKHGLVREVEGRGTARERWWERTPGVISVTDEGENATPAGREMVEELSRQWNELHAQNVRDFLRYSGERMPAEWRYTAEFSTTNQYLPREALEELVQRYHDLLEEIVGPYRNRRVPGTRPVQVQFNVFPLIGGEEVSE